MNVEVLFLPTVATDLPSKLCVVIDELRATSTLIMMLNAGARQVILADGVAGALSLAKALPEGTPVCGERGGLPPDGFTHGNSPREFAPGSLDGKDVVFCTSNGTKAMWEVAEAPTVLAASLFNATAAVQAAFKEARENQYDISLVCSGDIQGTKFAIDDAFVAGYLALLLEREAARYGESDVHLEESAKAAVRLYRSYLVDLNATDDQYNPPREAILNAFWESLNAHVLKGVGLAADVEYCAQVDISDRAPRLHIVGDRLILR
ncbi:MAG: 2-phosphosulfolactate phosphatase [Chloroflexota bacterium]